MFLDQSTVHPIRFTNQCDVIPPLHDPAVVEYDDLIRSQDG